MEDLTHVKEEILRSCACDPKQLTPRDAIHPTCIFPQLNTHIISDTQYACHKWKTTYQSSTTTEKLNLTEHCICK